MKIEQHENNATGNVFTFPHNPNTYSDKSKKNMETNSSATYWDYYTLGDPELKSKRDIIIKGHFDGTSKNENYRGLYKEMHDNKIKRFFFASDKFMIVLPVGLERTHTGGKTNFIDYVGNFVSPFNVLFGDPLNETDAVSALENDGNMPSPLIEIKIENLINGEEYKVVDSQGNGFDFTASESGHITISLIKMINIGGGFYMSWYYEATYDSGAIAFLGWANSSNPLFLRLQPGEAISTIDPRRDPSSANVDISTDLTITWGSAYSSD